MIPTEFKLRNSPLIFRFPAGGPKALKVAVDVAGAEAGVEAFGLNPLLRFELLEGKEEENELELPAFVAALAGADAFCAASASTSSAAEAVTTNPLEIMAKTATFKGAWKNRTDRRSQTRAQHPCEPRNPPIQCPPTGLFSTPL